MMKIFNLLLIKKSYKCACFEMMIDFHIEMEVIRISSDIVNVLITYGLCAFIEVRVLKDSYV